MILVRDNIRRLNPDFSRFLNENECLNNRLMIQIEFLVGWIANDTRFTGTYTLSTTQASTAHTHACSIPPSLDQQTCQLAY